MVERALDTVHPEIVEAFHDQQLVILAEQGKNILGLVYTGECTDSAF